MMNRVRTKYDHFALQEPPPEFAEGKPVDALFNGEWFRGDVDEVIRNPSGKITNYEVLWADGTSNRIPPSKVRAPVSGTKLG